MTYIIDLFTSIFNKIITILDTLKFPGSSSLLMYLLGAIILGFIVRLVKGSSNEFESTFNFSTASIVKTKASSYRQNNDARKKQIVNDLNTKGYADITPKEYRKWFKK